MSEEVLLTLGDYQFGMSTAAHDAMARTRNYRWAQQQRLSREPASQYVGPGDTTIELKGSIYPHFRGGLEQIDDMKDEADQGKPLTLVDGRGNNLGEFCIKTLKDTETRFIGEGQPRRIDFSMSLVSYGKDDVSSGDSGGGSDSGSGIDWGGIINGLSIFA